MSANGYFECTEHAALITPEFCLRRQFAMSNGQPEFVICSVCDQGVRIRKQHPEMVVAAAAAAGNGKKKYGSGPLRPPKTCSVEGCGEPARGRGLCIKHYMAARYHGRKKPPEPKAAPEPKVEIKKEANTIMAEQQRKQRLKGCGNNAVKGGLCTRHYREEHGCAPFGENKGEAVPSTKSMPPGYGMTISINLGKYPDIYNRLKERAEKEVRSPEEQIIYMLKEALAS